MPGKVVLSPQRPLVTLRWTLAKSLNDVDRTQAPLCVPLQTG